jgi:hypothetical protein
MGLSTSMDATRSPASILLIHLFFCPPKCKVRNNPNIQTTPTKA